MRSPSRPEADGRPVPGGTAARRVLVLTGTCGSGKSTVSNLLSEAGWSRVGEDESWTRLFGRDRGLFGSAEHRAKRRQVHEAVFDRVAGALEAGLNVVIDATVHEAPPEAFLEYRAFFERRGIEWELRVLHPRLEVAVERDAARRQWTVGPERVALLHAKFTGLVFAPEWFLDTSEQSPSETASLLWSHDPGIRVPRRRTSVHGRRARFSARDPGGGG
jgi:predicted kinase